MGERGCVFDDRVLCGRICGDRRSCRNGSAGTGAAETRISACDPDGSTVSGLFELEMLPTVYVPYDADQETFRELTETYQPKGMISVERCGRNRFLQYANMRG